MRIYVEGGGDQRANLARCREGFAEFFRKVLPSGHLPRVIACGGRNAVLDHFKIDLETCREGFVAMLVDSEGPVEKAGACWEHLLARDNWPKPPGAGDDQAHLMVQCMESWFLADKQTLSGFYGQGFLTGSLPRRANIEEIPKDDVSRSLQHATRNTKTKGEYHKTRHGFELLSLIDPAKVAKASAHAKRLVKVVKQRAVGS
jgi:hypothetical protein